jgi:hypothetical protein
MIGSSTPRPGSSQLTLSSHGKMHPSLTANTSRVHVAQLRTRLALSLVPSVVQRGVHTMYTWGPLV